MTATEIKPLKIRAWKLDRGTFLVLVFVRGSDDRLTLLEEAEVDTEEQIHEICREAQERLKQVMGDAGIKGEVRAEFAGAKKA